MIEQILEPILNSACYNILKDFSMPVTTIIVAYFTVRFSLKKIEQYHENTLKAQKADIYLNTRVDLFKDVNELINPC